MDSNSGHRAESRTEKLWIGPAGWSYKDWKGVVYPRGSGRRFDPLEYLAGFFDVVEIDSSFYRPPPERWARSWVRRVADHPRFRFTAKLWRRFTHEREARPTGEEVAQVREGFDALAEEDRLLAVLAQFPWSFRNGPAERRWLEGVAETFADYPLALEVRHASWDEPETVAWLADRGIALATIDQPLHAGSLEPVDHRTAPIAYYRFHGRNFEAWFAEGRPSHERYDYLYDREELEPWAERIRAAAAESAVQAVIAITNNHYQGQAAVNALQLKAWTTGRRVPVPEPLLDAYPDRLQEVAAESAAELGSKTDSKHVKSSDQLPAQRDLFGEGRR